MLHTTHKSEVARNYIYGTGEKCLFIYTSANNDIHDNRFESCGIGVHFTGGSENNKFSRQRFIGNETQVKYTGTQALRVVGGRPRQLLERQPGLRPRRRRHRRHRLPAQHLVDWVLWKYPLAKLLLNSPAVQMLRYVQEQFPRSIPAARRQLPLMAPPRDRRSRRSNGTARSRAMTGSRLALERGRRKRYGASKATRARASTRRRSRARRVPRAHRPQRRRQDHADEAHPRADRGRRAGRSSVLGVDPAARRGSRRGGSSAFCRRTSPFTTS